MMDKREKEKYEKIINIIKEIRENLKEFNKRQF